jgi:hypothetical protein
MNDPIVITSKGVVCKHRRRFRAIDRAVEKARREIMEREDADFFKLLDSIASEGGDCNYIVITAKGKVRFNTTQWVAIRSALAQLNQRNLVPTKLWMNESDFKDILKWAK